MLLVVWRRERQDGLRCAAGGYLLALVAATGALGAPVALEAVVWRGLVAWAVGLYVGAGLAWRVALLVPPLAIALLPGTWSHWALAYLDLAVGLSCIAAARRQHQAGHELLAMASLASLAAFAAALGARDAFEWQQRYLWPTALIFGIVLPVAAMMREHELSRSARALTQRMTNFYDVLSRTNQAIVRIKEPKALFEAISQICVEAGHARMACVYVLDGVLARRAATAGPAAEILSGIPQPWDTSQPAAQGSYTVQALREGRSLASNDYQNDPRAAPWRDEAVKHGVHAFAWLPFRRRGGVAGVLMLAADQTDFFDPPLVALLDKLVGDISLALDAIEQEHARERSHREAEASLRRFQQLFNTAPLPSSILSIDDRRVLAVNDACCESFGLAREEMIGRRTADLPSRLDSDDREALYAELRSRGRVRNRLGRVHQPDGSFRYQLFNAEPIEYEGRACLLVLSLDITDLHEAEQVREALARAEAASRAKTEFLARMSHELRTPLNAVLGFTQLLRHDASERLNAQELAQLDLVQQAGWHLLTLINDVLDVSRIESGRMVVQVRPLALVPLLDEAIELNRAAAAEQGISLQADYDGLPAPGVLADPTRLRQVLFNLLSNALKYNRPGGLVRLALQTDEDRVHLLIEDTGVGMTPDQLAHLYEPFNRLGREGGAVEGTGIGLVLTRQLLWLMRGEIAVDSAVDRGTRVRVSLPRAEAPPPEAPPAPTRAGLAAPQGTVLYIEDNEVNVLLVQQLLARWAGVRFVHAHNGRQGLDMVRSLRPGLVLLDMQLPDIDGLEVLRRLKDDPATRELPVIALSASAMPEDVARARALGVTAYWTKPIAFDQFLEGVAHAIEATAVAT
ncbi:MAG: response regulator [Piscinibacter sp.]|nr:response regulator [Piscinibacter sp.]